VTQRPEVAVGAVVTSPHGLLLIQRGQPPGMGRWSLPGGRVEWGETLATAVERELLEETGLLGRCGDIVGWVERIDAEHHYLIMDFSVDVDDPTNVRAASDARQAGWVPVRDVAHWPLVDGLASFLTDHEVIPAAP